MKFYLLYGESEELEITSECQIGRRNGDLKFSDELLSGTHAKFLSDGEKLYVTDLGSSNGTFVNKKKIEALVPHELNHGDQITMGAQLIKIKIGDSEHTRFEEEVQPAGEATRIESPLSVADVEEVISSIQVARDESPVTEAPAISIARDAEAPSPILLKSESTHIESLSELTPAEAYHPKPAPRVLSEHTHIEAENPALQSEDAGEHTHIETAKEAAPPAAAHLKIVESEPRNHIKPARIIRDDSPNPNLITHISRSTITPTEPHPIVAVANDMESVFGAKKIMIASAVIIGVFAYLLSNSKNVDRAIARIEEKKTQAPQSFPDADAEKPVVAEAASSTSVQSTANSEISASPNADVNKTESSSSSAIQLASSSLSEEETSESSSSSSEAKAKAKSKSKKKEKSKVTKKSAKPASTEAALKSTKKDPYSEATLLKQLSKMKDEAKRTKSYRVKAALEVDAVDLTAAHYKKFKTAILLKWKKSRGLASTEKDKLKKTLQGQIVALNNREKTVRAKIAPYINGKIETPFK